MLRRLRKRAESSGRIDDNPDAFKKRLDTYQKESLPVVDYLRGKVTVKTVCPRLCNLYGPALKIFRRLTLVGLRKTFIHYLGPRWRI